MSSLRHSGTSLPFGRLCADYYALSAPLTVEYPDVPYYREALSTFQGRILEAAVGTGRLLLPLLKAGYAVDGADDSPFMLSHCRAAVERSGLVSHLHLADIRSGAFAGRYQAIIIAFGTFSLFADASSADAVLRNAWHHLDDGGVLFLDIPQAPSGSTTPRALQQSRTVTGTDGKTIVMHEVVSPTARSRTTCHRVRYEEWREDRLLACESQHLSMRWYSELQIVALLRSVGFHPVSTVRNFGAATLDPGWGEILSIAAHKPLLHRRAAMPN